MLGHKWIDGMVGVLVLLFCVGLLPSRADERANDIRAEDDRLAQSNLAFGCDLYKTLSKRQGNLFFSPYSVSNALAIVLAGAKGETAEEIARALHVCGDEKTFHASFAHLNKRIQPASHNDTEELLVANAFWRQNGLMLRSAFTAECARSYEVEFGESDFAGNAEGARLSINQWVEHKTKDKIQELLKAGSVSDKTRFVLANAIYFKGKWSVPFAKKLTLEEDFLVDFKERMRVPTMKQKLITDYHSADGMQTVSLPYAGNRLSLYVFMGETEKTLHVFESQLSPQVVNDHLGRLRKHVVDVSMPRFRLTDDILLNEPLSRLGISKGFSLNADLSGIADSREKLSIGSVVHKSYLDVNEEGVEAAAATAVVGITPVSASKPLPNARFVMDRPFLFLIRDKQTGTVLFLGRLMKPRD